MEGPLIGSGAPESTAAASLHQWTLFLRHALVTRLELEQFTSFVPLLQSSNPLSPSLIADLFLRPTPANPYTLDPRILYYMQVLLDLKYIDTPSILKALYRYSTSQTQTEQHQKLQEIGVKSEAGDGGNEFGANGQKKKQREILRWTSSYATEEYMFYRLTNLLTKPVAPATGINSGHGALEVAILMAKWMRLFTAASTAFAEDEMGQLHGSKSRAEMESARAAFVMLLLGLCENKVVLDALGKPEAKQARKALSESLTGFVPTIMQSSSEIAARLELIRSGTLAAFEPVDKTKEAANAEMDEFIDATMGLDNFVIPELPIVNSRAGLYIYLNAALIGRPLLDDTFIHDYLNNRYQGDIQTTARDLILASFDVLANASLRSEPHVSAPLLRSYLINKLPLILASLATSTTALYPFDPEYCITEALGHVDTGTFPTLSALFVNGKTNPFTESVRQDFCFACCLHGLVAETSIDKLISDETYQSLPTAGRLTKERLVQECIADHDKMQQLIPDIDNMDGNVGAVCQALTEMLGQLCANKDTMTLKILCSQLARRPLALDVMLLFDKTATILYPLCDLLDNWRYDEDQGEYQPVYEEFGSILLFLLAFVHRYNLSSSDLGARPADSFVSKLLGKGNLSRPLNELSDQETGQLNGWIHGLFDTDAGGLGDELMSSCPPQDFYLLIPTLFQNIVLAVSTGNLSDESLKTGVEYLVDTFLLPSLVTAILYISNHLWTHRPEEQKAILKILQLILQPSQISNEATQMHGSMLNIVAKPLEGALRSYQRQNPASQDVEPLLKTLKKHITLSRRTGGAGQVELEAWACTPSGGLSAAIKHTMQTLVHWGALPRVSVAPASYTHRQTLIGLKLLGAKKLLYIILEELQQQTKNGHGSVAYDIATALVCAPDVTTEKSPSAAASILGDGTGNVGGPASLQQRRLSLREVLKWEAEDWKKIQKKDPDMAETIVRLYRRVEAQMAVSQTQVMLQADHDLAAAHAVAVGMGDTSVTDGLLSAEDHMVLDGSGLDFGSGAGSASGMDLTADDMFTLGSIDAWDSMEM